MSNFSPTGLFEKMMETVRQVIASGSPSRVDVSADGRDVAHLYIMPDKDGFTWADVDILRQAADDAESEARPYPDGRADARAPFDALAERIAALLPPRA